ncbi:MAG TPA: hypothetical protein VHG91_11305 [Longimicrobium sp.]|nr:hypothetical protein [Longimicrobium sp.]
MYYSKFAVGNEPYCLWDWDLPGQSREFVEQMDPMYFDYVARSHLAALEGEEAKRAAIALRVAYHHGLESFFALLCATLQAPDCLVGWLQKYQLGHLREILSAVFNQGSIFNKLKIQNLSWETISDRIHQYYSHPDTDREAETKRLYALLWGRFAADFLDADYMAEYNSIKHGFRARSGGFVLRGGIEQEYGVPAPEENMQTIGASEFGMSFLVAESIGASKRDPHFRVTQRSLNWSPEAMIIALQLISMSIHNILSFLKCFYGAAPQTIRYIRPEDSTFFDAPWTYSVGAHKFTFKIPIEEGHIKRFSNQDILAAYDTDK